MKLTGSQLETAGRLMFGDKWISQMSEFLNVDYRRVKQWRRGDIEIPQGVISEIVDYLKKNAEKELQFAEKIENS
ncbi:hypothetical protein CEP45_04020 [Mergibacter septicus]|uniref:hypothetical protein n=1 Tax=Mergibacter septicus TaxID=221402 RepID=UPI001C777597|nr:hypothetical protein [Mergibacter septicus]QDJ13067.1 hypothetical protein CEP45_04020 [Mergibacter septicus]